MVMKLTKTVVVTRALRVPPVESAIETMTAPVAAVEMASVAVLVQLTTNHHRTERRSQAEKWVTTTVKTWIRQEMRTNVQVVRENEIAKSMKGIKVAAASIRTEARISIRRSQIVLGTINVITALETGSVLRKIKLALQKMLMKTDS